MERRACLYAFHNCTNSIRIKGNNANNYEETNTHLEFANKLKLPTRLHADINTRPMMYMVSH